MDATTHHDLRTTVRIEVLGGFAVVVDGDLVPDAAWSRRSAGDLVKLLALAPDRRLHREQVIDALWPDELVSTAAPRLHKAAHFARRGLGVPEAIVVRGEQVALCPDADVEVDAVEFERAAREALRTGDRSAAAVALAHYAGDLLRADLYADWAAAPREQLRQLHLDLLRVLERWDAVLEVDPADEEAHLALMRRYAASGDRHAALRQFERLDRHLSTELGLAPSPAATALRDELLAERRRVPRTAGSLLGRRPEAEQLARLVADCADGASRAVFVEGRAGIGKSALLDHVAEVAAAGGFRIARGVAAAIEGEWPFAPVVEALADLCRRHPALLDGLADTHRAELERASSGAELPWSGESSHARLFVAAAELLRLASATSGLLVTLDDMHDADDASLRLLHYLARSTADHRVLIAVGHRPNGGQGTLAEIRASLVGRHQAVDLPLGPLGVEAAVELVRREAPDLHDDHVARVLELADGVPFALRELARRMADDPADSTSLDVEVVAGIDPALRQPFQRVAVTGSTFDTDDFVALAGLPEPEAFDALDRALDARLIEPSSGGYRFRHALVRDALVADLPPHGARRIHREAAARLIDSGGSPARIGHHLTQAGEPKRAVPYLLRAAETDAAIGAYRDALAIVDAMRPHTEGSDRTRALALRGDLLNALGDPMAASAYREALDGAAPAEVPRLRALLARSAVMAGDFDTAAAALDGLEPDGGDHDVDILLAKGNLAYFAADFDTAAAAAADAERRVLNGQPNWKVLDLVSLQGLLAHRAGTWFDRMRLELERTRAQPDVANSIFDGHLCATEYVLYGHTPYDEVLRIAGDLRGTAQRSGALRATAFATVLIGEAALLSGDLERAETELLESIDLHRDLGSTAGEAVSLLRLGEVRIAEGRHEEATELLQRALPLARTSMIPNHLLQRIYGGLILAAPDPVEARAVVDRAESTLGWDEVCLFCSIMFDVPAAVACAAVGDLDQARHHLEVAEGSAALWEGTSWEAALEEARGAVAREAGEREEAAARYAAAVAGFERAGQPLDARRCRDALDELGRVTTA